CGSWTPGAGRTTFEAPSSDVVETMIAFGAPIDASVRLEHLRVVGPSRASGDVSALRFTGGSAPVVRDVHAAGGMTNEGHSVTVGIEGSSPTIEDGDVRGGSARCTAACAGAYANGISVAGG